MRERGISVDEVKLTLMKGQKWVGKRDGNLHAAMGRIEAVLRRNNCRGDMVLITVENR